MSKPPCASKSIIKMSKLETCWVSKTSAIVAVCGEGEKYTDVRKPGTTLPCAKGERLNLIVCSKKGVKLDGCKYLGALTITRDDDADAERQAKLAKLEALKQQYAAKDTESVELKEDSTRRMEENVRLRAEVAEIRQRIQAAIPEAARNAANTMNALVARLYGVGVAPQPQQQPIIVIGAQQLPPVQQANFVLPNTMQMPTQRPSANGMFFFGGSK